MASKAVALKSASAGFRSDMETLFNAFFATGSVRFDRFASVWRLLNFSFIFKGKQSRNEMREFIDEIFAITLAQLKSTSLHRRIACLYLLYALYNKQQIEPKVSIRITVDKLQTLRYLYETCKAQKHLDAVFIWMKLLSQGAFDFVCDAQLYGPSFIKSIRISENDNSEANDLVNQLSLTVVPQIDEISRVHSQYQQMKSVQESESVKSLNLIESDIFDEFKDRLSRLHQQFNCEGNINYN